MSSPYVDRALLSGQSIVVSRYNDIYSTHCYLVDSPESRVTPEDL
jgi:hypothetical protein